MTAIDACIADLEARRAQIDAAIEGLRAIAPLLANPFQPTSTSTPMGPAPHAPSTAKEGPTHRRAARYIPPKRIIEDQPILDFLRTQGTAVKPDEVYRFVGGKKYLVREHLKAMARRGLVLFTGATLSRRVALCQAARKVRRPSETAKEAP